MRGVAFNRYPARASWIFRISAPHECSYFGYAGNAEVSIPARRLTSKRDATRAMSE
jgi:hypothetical protein